MVSIVMKRLSPSQLEEYASSLLMGCRQLKQSSCQEASYDQGAETNWRGRRNTGPDSRAGVSLLGKGVHGICYVADSASYFRSLRKQALQV